VKSDELAELKAKPVPQKESSDKGLTEENIKAKKHVQPIL
jgi:hypothetical protein